MAVLLEPTPSSLFDLRTIITGAAILIVSYLLQTLVIYPLLISPNRKIPGPGRGNLILGHLGEIFRGDPGVPHRKWVQKYPHGIVRYFAGMGSDRLMITDPKALHHVLVANAYDFPKAESTRTELSRILGKGVLFAEGDDHRRQRRIMNPAFINSHIASLVPIFFDKTQKLVDKWTDLVAQDQSEKKGALVNIESWLSRCTLDIIGSTGFGYEFGALDNDENALAKSFTRITNMSGRRPWYILPIFALVRFMPWIVKIPTKRLKIINENMENMVRESTLIVQNKQANDPEHTSNDLLSLLLRANEREGKQAMTQEEIRGQLTTFILAGHETTATALSWTLYELSKRPEMQDRLRDEIRAAGLKPSTISQGLTFDQINALPFLDAVVREDMRINPPVVGTLREARVDSVMPLSKPLPDGSSSVFIKAGQTFFFPIMAINTSTALFGEDAEEFRPERWMDGSTDKAQKEMTSCTLWSGQLGFLSGPRSCIGYRFALAELKAILISLITSFEFTLGLEDGDELERRSAIVMKPFSRKKPELGVYMPMRIRLAPE